MWRFRWGIRLSAILTVQIDRNGVTDLAEISAALMLPVDQPELDLGLTAR